VAPERDDALARRVAGGADPLAERLLYERLLARARAYGRSHLRDETDAADLAQHVVILVFDALRHGRVRDLAQLGAYLTGVCRNTVRAWRKGERRRRAFLERLGPEAAATVEPDVVPDRTRLAEGLRHLGERDRSIVALTYSGGHDSDEIARALDMSSGGVRVARHRALRRLGEWLHREAAP
jgi:RNA polymerase sigma-70 factor, ECF subfamily